MVLAEWKLEIAKMSKLWLINCQKSESLSNGNATCSHKRRCTFYLSIVKSLSL